MDGNAIDTIMIHERGKVGDVCPRTKRNCTISYQEPFSWRRTAV